MPPELQVIQLTSVEFKLWCSSIDNKSTGPQRYQQEALFLYMQRRKERERAREKSYFSEAFSGTSSDDLENLSINVFHKPFFSSSIGCRLPVQWNKKLTELSKKVCFINGHKHKCNWLWVCTWQKQFTLFSCNSSKACVSYTRKLQTDTKMCRH